MRRDDPQTSRGLGLGGGSSAADREGEDRVPSPAVVIGQAGRDLRVAGAVIDDDAVRSKAVQQAPVVDDLAAVGVVWQAQANDVATPGLVIRTNDNRARATDLRSRLASRST
jgi:hypothetical protein